MLLWNDAGSSAVTIVSIIPGRSGPGSCQRVVAACPRALRLSFGKLWISERTDLSVHKLYLEDLPEDSCSRPQPIESDNDVLVAAGAYVCVIEGLRLSRCKLHSLVSLFWFRILQATRT